MASRFFRLFRNGNPASGSVGAAAPAQDGEAMQEWVAEAEKRHRAWKAGKVDSLPADEAMQRARNRLK